MHQIQNNILSALLFEKTLRFSELNTNRISSDHFTFHLRRLIDQGLVEKNKDGSYVLTIIGKEYANRLDVNSEKVEIEKQAKTGVLVVCIDDSGSKRKYLVQQRLKHPYFGFYGFITGKIKWREGVYEAALRELEEETGLKAKLDLISVEHKRDYSKKGKLLEDKFFYIVKATNQTGQLIESFEGGRNTWLTEKEIKNLPDLFGDALKVIEVTNRGKFTFFEAQYDVKYY